MVVLSDQQGRPMTDQIDFIGLLRLNGEPIGAFEPFDGMFDAFQYILFFFYVIVFHEVDNDLGVCIRDKIKPLLRKKGFELLIILNNPIVNQNKMTLIGRVRMRIL